MQANDFGSEVIPGAKDLGMHVQAYLYDGYWEDIGTIEAFYQANLALTKNPKPDYRSAQFTPAIMSLRTSCSIIKGLLARPCNVLPLVTVRSNSRTINANRELGEVQGAGTAWSCK